MVTRNAQPTRRAARRQRPNLLLAVVTIALLALALGSVLDSSAQSIQIQANPTPTEQFDPGFQAQPTEEPTREPERVPPTEVPDEPEAPVATDVPQPAAPSSLTLNKGACDDTNFDPYTATGLQAFLDACFSPDGEFEFTVFNDVAFNTTASTELGSLFMQVPTGPLTITETIPAGWGEPAVFCWSNLFPTPSDTPFIGNSPMWDVAAGEDVECWWFNVSEPEPQGHTIRVIKQVCPEGFAIADDYWTLANGCQDRLDGVGFAMTVDAGTDEETTDAHGEIEWTDVDLGASGQVQLDEAIPDGYGEPVVWCVNFPQEAADAQDFEFFQVESTDGLIAALPEQEAPRIFSCTYFNVIGGDGAPGDFVDPAAVEDGEGGATVTVVKHRCPLGVPEDTTIDQYIVICAELFDGIPFTLEHEGGTFPGETGDDGQVEWPNVPAGEVEIQETIPETFKDPLVFCYFFQGEQELLFGEDEQATGGVIPLTIPDEATSVLCYIFNIQDPDLATSLTVNKWRCPIGFDKDAADPEAECTEPMDGVTFHLGDLAATSGEFIPGVAQFADIPTGEHTLTEDAPAGIDHAFIGGCSVNGDAVPLLLGETKFPSLEVLIEAGDHWVCEWYNVPAVESRVVVNKRICPEGVDFVLTDENTIDDIIDACPIAGDGIEFTLNHAGGASTEETDNDSIIWEGVPNGPIIITEHIPPGYEEPIWFCNELPFDEFGEYEWDPFGWELMAAPGGVLDESLDEQYGQLFTCWVFNTTGDDGDLIVHKWVCPAGYDVHAEGADPQVDCTDATTDGLQFQFGQPGMGAEAVLQGTGDVIEDAVVFTSLEPGAWQLVEFAPEWVESAFIGSCTVNGVPVPADSPLNEGFEWDVDIEAGEIIECHWYNVPDDGNSLTVHKKLCPEGFDPEVDNPEAECTEPMGGVTFTLGDLEATTGDDQGVALVEDVPVGEYELTEILPEGIAFAFFTHCVVPFGPILIPLVGAQPPVVTLEFDAGTHWECYWYNIPGEDNDILIYKWLCPEGTGHDEGIDWYFDNCTEALDDIPFKVMSDLGIAVLDTVGGMVGFGGFPSGMEIGIQEEIPEEYGEPVVFCRYQFIWSAYPAPAGFIEHTFEGSGETFTCHWFNIPGGAPDLTILKWTCPEGYDLFAAGADPSLDCTEATNGVTFELRYEGHEETEATQTTGDVIPGGVFFDDLQPDSYNVTELVPEGIDQVFVLECTGHIMGVLQPYPLQMGNVLDELDLDAGEHLVCHWYNVPEPDGGSIIVTKYTCTTETFVSEVDCEIEEDGKTFDLLHWNVGTGVWDVIDTQVTDGVGQIGWIELEAGDYGLDEHDGEWCHLTTNPVFGAGDFFSVFEDEETVVHVYNCDGVPGTPGETPTKYPNTGVPPSDDRRAP